MKTTALKIRKSNVPFFPLTSAIIRGIAIALMLLVLPQVLFSQTVQTINTGAFHKINAGGIINVLLTQGDTYLVEVETTEDNLDKVSAEVKNGTLMLNFKTSGRNASATVRVVAPEIDELIVSGAASLTGLNEISSTNLKLNISGASKLELDVVAENLETRGSGAVNVALAGQVNYHKLILSGASQLRALQLESKTLEANLSGASNARVWATDMLDAKASGTSKITYNQRPNSQVMNLSGMASVNDVTAADMRTQSYDEGDTMRIKIGRRDVVVIDGDKDKRTKRPSRRSFTNNWSGFELGINGYLSPEGSFTLPEEAELIDLRYNKSVAVNINFWQQNFPLISNNLGLVSGVGLGFNNYRFDNQTRILYTREGLDFFEETERNFRKNKMTLTWVNIPLLMEFQSHGRRHSEKFHLAGGVIFGARIGTHTKYVVDDGGRRRKEKDYHDFHVRPFRFDATARVGWGRVNLFATYALSSLFKDDKGPELYPFTVGIRLVSF